MKLNLKSLAAALTVASQFAASTSFAATNWSGATGPSIGQMSTNASTSMFGVANGFEAFLYLLGVVFMVLFILAAWKYKKSDGRDGNMGLVVTYLVLAVASMAAPSVMGSMKVSIFGSTSTTSVAPPSANFTGQ
jgi:hypothetical protein